MDILPEPQEKHCTTTWCDDAAKNGVADQCHAAVEPAAAVEDHTLCLVQVVVPLEAEVGDAHPDASVTETRPVWRTCESRFASGLSRHRGARKGFIARQVLATRDDPKIKIGDT